VGNRFAATSLTASPTIRVLAALLLGLIAGLVVRWHPAPALLSLVGIVEPIGTLWVNAIRMTVVPLVGSLLITGVASASELRTVRVIGFRALGAFAALLLVCTLFALVVVPPLFAGLHIAPETAALLRGTAAIQRPSIPSFGDWLVSVVPTNPIRAAADGAMLPLVVFTVAFGLALLTIDPARRQVVLAFFHGIADAMLAIVRVLIAIAPIGVFALMVPVGARAGVGAAGALGYYVVAMAAALLACTALLYAIAAFAGGISPVRFARGVFPAQAVAIASSSSLASLPAMVDGADRRLGLPCEVTGIVLPLAVSTFKAANPIAWFVAAIFLGRLYGVPVGIGQLLVIAPTAVLTSFSTPGVPHGWLFVISPLLAAMGIPAEGVGLLIAVDAVPDIIATMLNVTADVAAAGIVSRFSAPSAAAVVY
jgi:Na+/H+-dicarboxylate symporter